MPFIKSPNNGPEDLLFLGAANPRSDAAFGGGEASCGSLRCALPASPLRRRCPGGGWLSLAWGTDFTIAVDTAQSGAGDSMLQHNMTWSRNSTGSQLPAIIRMYHDGRECHCPSQPKWLWCQTLSLPGRGTAAAMLIGCSTQAGRQPESGTLGHAIHCAKPPFPGRPSS